MNPIAAGLSAHVNHRIPYAHGLAVENLALPEHTQRENIHQRIPVVAGLKHALAAHGRNAKTVPVMRDAAHHAFHNPRVPCAVLRIVQRSEPQRIHHRNRPRAHGENVAQNSAHARSRALKRLNETRMIVGFNLERNRPAVADIDNAGVLPRALQHQLAASRQLLQMQPRAFVRTVLAPHHAENAQLCITRLASKQRYNLFIFRASQLVRSDDFGCNCNHSYLTARLETMDLKITSPSLEPISSSAARSG